MTGRNAHFDSGAGRRPLKGKYYVDELGMVPPPNPRGHGQVDPGLLARINDHPGHYDAIPLTEVSLRAPVRASQPTVSKSKVDRVPRNAGRTYDPPKSAPFEGGVHLFDGHHRTGHALLHGHETVPMAMYDPDNPRHVAHMAEVHRRISDIQGPLNEHRWDVIRQHGFFGTPASPEAAAARAAFHTRQTQDTARIERIKLEGRTRWFG